MNPTDSRAEQFMKELQKDFIVESVENLDRMDKDLLAIEVGGADANRINSIFRAIHTIKGTSGSLGLGKIESVAHVGENLLSLLREGKIQLHSEMTTALLALSDTLREMLGYLEKRGDEGDTDYSALLAHLTELQKGTPTTAKPEVTDGGGGLFEEEPPAPAVKVATTAPKAEGVSKPTASAGGASSLSESAIRVDIALLDKLMNLVGELVLARNQIIQYTIKSLDPVLVVASQRLNSITTELQEGVMKTRMQPIGNVWGKFPRIIRDLSLEMSKKVRIELAGSETELDRSIIEAIKDPLTHLVRNSVDHGIESPERRVAAGKAEEGFIQMRAYHESGQVIIEIHDDGGGIDIERVKQKAVQAGSITAEKAARMSEREAASLIFLPGVSTATKVTNISGRGVGMDVVKTNIEKIGGSIDLQSDLGHGTSVKVKIPLTLAIVPALTVTTGGNRYAIPQLSLVELVRLDAAKAATEIESLHGAPVYRLRGKLLPVVYLEAVLGVKSARGERNGHAVNLVVLRAEEQLFGLVVDEINDTQEIVVKPLGKHMKGVSVFAGATIMGDGAVALILDVAGVAKVGHVLAEMKEGKENETARSAAGTHARARLAEALLLFSSDGHDRVAIPLNMVSRLDTLPQDKLERSGSREVVQQRRQIIPLVRLSDYLGTGIPQAKVGEDIDMIVCSEGSRSVGFVVDHIEDIIEEAVDIQPGGQRRGVLGFALIKGQVTELLDTYGIVDELHPGFFDATGRGNKSAEDGTAAPAPAGNFGLFEESAA